MVKPRFTWLPWLFAICYGVPAAIIVLFGNEWKLLPLYIVTLPAGIILEGLRHVIQDRLLAAQPATGEYALVDHIVSVIYVTGGTLWFAFLGFLFRWLLRFIFSRDETPTI